jgi:RNA polymerase sigma-70 factor (ECF subfamily)
MSDTESDGSNQRCFEVLFLENVDAVLGYALARTDPHTAQDVMSETFLTAWRRLEDVPNPARAWLIGVARKNLANQHRGRRRQQGLRSRLSRAVEPSATDTYSTDDQSVVLDAVRHLRPSDQELLTLVAWDGLDHTEAALVLGCSTKTFAVRLHRARRRFEAAISNGEPGVPGQAEHGTKGSLAKEVPGCHA